MKCAVCGAAVADYTDRPDLFSAPLAPGERRAVRVAGRLCCSYYRFAPPVTCAAIADRRAAEAEAKSLWTCGDCDGGTWSCADCGRDFPDPGEPCHCQPEED
jgi:hypothetical protein